MFWPLKSFKSQPLLVFVFAFAVVAVMGFRIETFAATGATLKDADGNGAGLRSSAKKEMSSLGTGATGTGTTEQTIAGFADHSSIETLLKLSKEEIERKGDKFTLDQKLSLKKIAFDSKSELQVRWRALVLAARLLGAEIEPEIKAAAKSSDWFMRSAAMTAAGEISPEQAAMLARKLVKDKALVVRSAAVDILGGTGEATDRDLLWKIIKDPINVRRGQSLWIRSQALQILAKKPRKTEVGEFIAILKDNDLELQAISIHALEQVSDFQFGSEADSIEDHKNRWLNWWELNHKSKTI